MSVEIKSLYQVLPAEKQMMATEQLSSVVGQNLILRSAKLRAVAKAQVVDMVVEKPDNRTQYKLSAGQPQIVEVVSWLVENGSMPVYVMFVVAGKTYAIVDPSEYKSKS